MADIMRNYNSRQQQKRGENSDTSLQKKKNYSINITQILWFVSRNIIRVKCIA